MATLAVADVADGATATATISSSSGGANIVYTQNVDGTLGSGTWTNSGSRTGDGTVTLTLSKGYYWSYCTTGGTTLSNLVYFQVTSGLDAVIDRCYDAVKATLQLLNLPCTTRVYDSQYALTPLVQYPCIVMTTEGARQTDEAAMKAAIEGSEDEAVVVAHKVCGEMMRIAKTYKNFLPTVEGCQDEVERQLILSGYAAAAKSYILYRAERAKKRAEEGSVPAHVRKLAEESAK